MSQLDRDASKCCVQCQRARPARDFLVSKFTADGLTDTCKPCILVRAAEHRANAETRAAARQGAEKPAADAPARH